MKPSCDVLWEIMMCPGSYNRSNQISWQRTIDHIQVKSQSARNRLASIDWCIDSHLLGSGNYGEVVSAEFILITWDPSLIEVGQEPYHDS
ncbi:hypothetical protein VNO77_27620 [Canavalia gladiata]|uniref:Uncharacterized protein n=1 Tax=Canavalia gladiata TaxID=3824 RepID=A0AAN9KZ65_CANGL